MKTIDLTHKSKLVAWAEDFVFAGEYTKADWEEDMPDFSKFNKLIANCPEDKRIACIYVMHGEDAAREAFHESKFKHDLTLTLPGLLTR